MSQCLSRIIIQVHIQYWFPHLISKLTTSLVSWWAWFLLCLSAHMISVRLEQLITCLKNIILVSDYTSWCGFWGMKPVLGVFCSNTIALLQWDVINSSLHSVQAASSGCSWQQLEHHFTEMSIMNENLYQYISYLTT